MATVICYSIIHILEACILWQYCKNLFQPKYTRKTQTLALFFCYFVLFWNFMFENIWMNSILFLIVNFSYIFFIYHTTCLAAFFHSLLLTIILMLSELSIIIIYNFPPSFYDERNYFRNIIILFVSSKSFYIFILQCISFYIKRKKIRKLHYNENTMVFIVTPLIFGFYAFIFTIIHTNIHVSLLCDAMLSICALLLLATNFFLGRLRLSIQEKEQKIIEMQLRLQKEYDTAIYYKELYKQDQKQKILIHDIRQHLQAIALLNEKKENEKITAYISQILHASDLQNTIQFCDNILLNAIVFRTKQLCKKFNISFITDIRAGCIDFLTEYDLTALFSNLLDNALDATKNIPDSYIELNVIPSPHNSSNTIITMKNSCLRISFNKNMLQSSKKNKLRHGYGMKSVQGVIKKYEGNSHLYFDEKKFTFHTIIILKQKDKK